MMQKKNDDGFRWDYLDIVDWYSRIDVRFEIIKQLLRRETIFLVSKVVTDERVKYSRRMLKIHNVTHLDIHLRATKMFERRIPYNFYYSIAKYKDGIPNQTLDMRKRDNTGWIKMHHNHIEHYDFFIDIDCDSHDEIRYAKDSMLEITSLFDDLKVPYSARFSGRGFHIIVPGHFFSNTNFDPKDGNSIYKLYVAIAKQLYERCSELVDMTIYDSRRITKIPYSLSIYEDEIYVCHPFGSWQEMKDFCLKDYTLENYENTLRENDEIIRNRGVHLFNADGDVKRLLEWAGVS